jgi:hypothetical protein
MNLETWKASLDAAEKATQFESALETFGDNLISAEGSSTGYATELQHTHEYRPKWSLVNPLDSQVWQQRVEEWVHQALPEATASDEEDERDPFGGIKAALQPRIDLMKALFGHGILTENDLRLLPPPPYVIRYESDPGDEDATENSSWRSTSTSHSSSQWSQSSRGADSNIYKESLGPQTSD